MLANLILLIGLPSEPKKQPLVQLVNSVALFTKAKKNSSLEPSLILKAAYFPTRPEISEPTVSIVICSCKGFAVVIVSIVLI